RWTAFRKIKPQLAIIQEKIKQRQTPVRLVYGKHDRIILSSVGEKFKKGIDKECNITILDAGHHLLQEKFTKEILSALQQ
ncbi:MAG: alpha/beta hydrolase, partial [Chitinophagaceae bacterium]|nr:alpha/beta hydrolase [Chitinophagaceae bacterium]